ncbi:histone deacetylase [Nocardioides sp.]|uniref:histone deacetylase n=1 Tax=Nocardioides sp. TaxID=35761 RepID=UPI0032194C12
MTSETPEIWYAAYGSNLDPRRLACYLEGGTPPGGSRATPGARDPRPPRAARALMLPGDVYFAWDSPTWGGGVAFLDPEGAGTSPGCAYLLSQEQFSDVVAQEMHRPPGTDLDLGVLGRRRSWAFGEGRYETMHVLGEVDGVPVVTFTAPSTAPLDYRAPSRSYLTVMGLGLMGSHGWDAGAVASHLMGCRGIGETWTVSSIAALLGTRR